MFKLVYTLNGTLKKKQMQAFTHVHVYACVHAPPKHKNSYLCNGIMSGALPDNSLNYFKTKEIEEDSL